MTRLQSIGDNAQHHYSLDIVAQFVQSIQYYLYSRLSIPQASTSLALYRNIVP